MHHARRQYVARKGLETGMAAQTQSNDPELARLRTTRIFGIVLAVILVIALIILIAVPGTRPWGGSGGVGSTAV